MPALMSLRVEFLKNMLLNLSLSWFYNSSKYWKAIRYHYLLNMTS